MKKKLSILLAVAMILSLVPTMAFAADRTTVTATATTEITGPTTFTDTDFTINSAIPLFKLTSNNASLTLNNCTITYTVGGTGTSSAVCAKAIQIETGLTSIGVTLIDTTINMSNQYSIGIMTVDGAAGNITLTNSKILFALTAAGTHSVYSRGIEASGLTINLNNSEISDCYYPIWVRGTVGGTTVNVANSKLSGYCAINVRNSNNTIDVTNGSQLIGTNYYSGGSDDFDVINFYVGAGATNNTVTVTNSTVSAIQLGTATQYIIAEESAGGANQVTLGTGTSVYYPGITKYVIAGEECNSSTSVIDSAAIFNGVGDTEVTADVNPTYTIVIPASVDFGTLIKGTNIVSKPFNVTASGLLIEYDAHVDVYASSDFAMYAGSADLPYSLYNTTTGSDALEDGDQFASFNTGATQSGRVEVDTSDIDNAGDFEDTMVFTITYVG